MKAGKEDQPLISLSVHSETGRLRVVMVHRPGPELDRMVPAMREEFLFDDILHGDRAREEHDIFRRVLEKVADEVLEVQTLLAESLTSPACRDDFLGRLALLERLPPATLEALSAMDGPELAGAVIGGLERAPRSLARDISPGVDYLLHPLPNMLFMRDPLVVVGEGAVLGSMARGARRREPFLMKFTYTRHPRLQLERQGGFYFDESPLLGLRRKIRVPGLEGGDILVLSDRVLAIGASERTSELAVDLLAQELREKTQVEVILMVLLPKKRATMHLDTVFTVLSPGQCLVYPPMFLPGGSELAPVIKKDLRGRKLGVEVRDSLLEALREEGIDLEPICCGGPGDRINQQREQWSDGANALALAPGIITLYERNVHTAEELSRHGFEVVRAEEVLARDMALDRPTAILLPGTELSRARGGPRCMAMPLVRDPE